jgi:hypothetical protein
LKREHAGTWRAVVSLTEADFERYRRELGGERGARPRPQGVAFQFIVTAESNVRMVSRVQARGHSPGSTIGLRVSLSDRGLALDGALVHARVHSPAGGLLDLPLRPSSAGLYEASFVAADEGVYECRVSARGHTARGDAFTREETLTAHAWRGLAPNPERVRAREAERTPRLA